jgi:DNA (cytosine-5)-methyltransferase 1
MKHGSLFSGIGGFDLAAEWMGWENIFHCEIAENFHVKLLKYHFPNSICYEDIKKTDFTKHRGEIDIISGGFPCQPYSNAGKRRGKEDDRHLWPEMLRVIREVQPRFVVGENVSGLLTWNNGMVFHEIITDLENEGYETQAFFIPACATNAPHQRFRIWFVAHSNNARTNEQMQFNGERKENDEQWRGQSQSEYRENGINGITTDTDGTEQRNNTIKCWRKHWRGKEKYGGEKRAMYLENYAVMGMLPTPMASDCGEKVTGLENQNSMVKITREMTGKTSQLNPLFVAEMMGFPPNWTVLPFQNGETNQSKDTEMP